MLLFEKIKQKAKQFAIYGLGNIAQSALSFILLPVYLKYFSPEDYGVITILMLVISFVGMFASAGMMSALHRLYFSNDEHKRKRLVGTTLCWHFASGGVLGTIIYIFSNKISMIFFHSFEYSYIIRLVSIIIFFTFTLDVPFNIFRLEKKAGKYVIFSLIRFFTNFVFKILFIIVLNRGIKGYFESGLLSVLIVFITINIFIIKYVSFSFKLQFLKQLLRLGIPFIFSGFAIWSLNFCDRLILNFFWGKSPVGIYAAGNKFSQIFNVILFMPFSLLLPPLIFSYAENHSENETKKLLEKLFYLLVFIGGAFYLIISLASGDFLHILNNYYGTRNEYLASIPLIPVLTAIPFLYFLGFPASYALLIAKKPEFNSISAVIAAVLNIILNFIMIPSLKEMGAALSTAISYFVYEGFLYFWAYKKYPINYKWKSIFLELIFLIVSFFASYFITLKNYWIDLPLRTLLSLIMFFLLSWYLNLSGLIKDDTRKEIIKNIKQSIAKLFTKTIKIQ